MSGHAYLSPSSAHRWLTCVGSPVLEAQSPDASSAAAERGTLLHEIVALWMSAGLTAPPEPGTLAPEDHDHAARGFEALRAIADTCEEWWVERRLPMSALTGEEGAQGTADFIGVRAGGELVIADLKFGTGVHVRAKGNPQLALYALGGMDFLAGLHRIQSVELAIIQPAFSAEPDIWRPTMGELLLLANRVRLVSRTALRLRDVPLEHLTGYLQPEREACRFCRAAPACPALAKAIFGEKTEEPWAGLSDARRMELADLAEMWAKRVRDDVLARTRAGEPTGFKLVAGRAGRRRFSDEVLAMSVLVDEGVERDLWENVELRSPAQLERALARRYPDTWNRLQQYIETGPPSEALVPVTDPRPALQPNVDVFPELC